MSPAEQRKRGIQWNNWKREVPRLRAEVKKLRRENRALKAEIRTLKGAYEVEVEALKLRVEELSIMVFGRKQEEETEKGESIPEEKQKKLKKSRPHESFRRPCPKPEEVTQRETYGVSHICPRCGDPLRPRATITRFLEDIVLWMGEGLNRLKIVTEQTIETAECPRCRKRFSAIPISKQMTSLEENVRSRIVYAITRLGQPWQAVREDLRTTFGMEVSEGEIASILRGEATAILPEFHAIGTRIREGPANHKDETSWPVQREGQGNYAWVETASDGPDTRYLLGRSRGKGNAKELQMGHEDQPTVTDQYGAYEDLENHGLCWAHPKHKFKELAESDVLPTMKRAHCAAFYGAFCRLYLDVAAVVDAPYDQEARKKAAEAFVPRIGELMQGDDRDPRKLMTWKNSFREHTQEYLLCVREPKVPMTNNKAEREIRHLVVKRKLGFGSRTQRGADTMSILLSVSRTIQNRKPENFYAEYRRVKEECRAMRA